MGLMALLNSCEGFLDTGVPRSMVATSSVFENDKTAEQAMVGLYSSMAFGSNNTLNGRFNIACALYADDLEGVNNGCVITSYSIHYTKLYDQCRKKHAAEHVEQYRVFAKHRWRDVVG